MFPIEKKLGGRIKTRALLKAKGVCVSGEAEKKWRNRGLPSHVKFELTLEAQRRGILITEEDFEWPAEGAA